MSVHAGSLCARRRGTHVVGVPATWVLEVYSRWAEDALDEMASSVLLLPRRREAGASPDLWRSRVRIGIGLPAAVPGADMTTLGQWAADSERAGFDAVGVFDRLVYDNLEPPVALAVAAARTERVELLTTVLNVGWRQNPALLAKQMASVEQVSGRSTCWRRP